MYIANPVRLPITTDMLSQPNLVMHHKDHTVFSRTAWLLSIDLSRQEFFFLNGSENCCPHPGGQVHKQIMLVNSSSSTISAARDRLSIFSIFDRFAEYRTIPGNKSILCSVGHHP